MPIPTRAAVLDEVGAPFRIDPVRLDDPQPFEVVVRIVAAGVCGTDIGVQVGHIPFPLPGVVGHEGAGIVQAVGSAVTTVQPGDKVLLTFTSCGVCASCRRGHPAYCVEFLPRNLLGGARADGSSTVEGDDGPLHAHFFAQSSFSELVLAEERSVTRVAPDADLALLAPLGCGIQTGAGAVLNMLRPEPGSSIAVFGAGAVGLAAVMAARLTGATRIICVDIVPSRLELASELGATHTIDSRDTDLAEALMRITDGAGLDYAIDATGNARVLQTAIHTLSPLGTAVAIGAPDPGTTVPIDINYLLNGRRVIGVTEGDSQPQLFLPALVDLVQQGRLPLEKLITRFPFDAINDAAAAIRSGSAVKPVLTFDQAAG